MAPDKSIRTKKMIQLMFQDYYRTNHDTVDIPDRVHNREFGLENWDYSWVCKRRREERDDGKEIWVGCGRNGRSFANLQTCPHCGAQGLQTTRWSRHIGYRTKDNLLNDLVKTVPHSVYHSAAFYNVPVARSMAEKEWIGAELIFDIDADHLDAPCASKHDVWQCSNHECGITGNGPHPDNCPDCDGTAFRSLKWICDECLTAAKNNTIKLYDKFLTKHFGLDPEKIQLNYSGHRGFHVRVQDPLVFNLDSNGRMELAHYVIGLGLNSTITTEGYLRIKPTGELRNWQLPSIARKIADAMIEFIDSIEKYKGNETWVKSLQLYKEDAIEGLQKNPPILSAKVKKVGPKYWQEIASKAAILYSAEIDQPVTTDIHRVIRLIGSLNGKTGFAVSELSRDNLTDFDPLTHAIAFKEGTLKVSIPDRAITIPEIRIGGSIYGPFNDSIEELPTPAAVFLLCKGMAYLE
ncbi:MAG: DNA primase small subunit domain-containing protein [Candidatus Thorarchaeota archaeon]